MTDEALRAMFSARGCHSQMIERPNPKGYDTTDAVVGRNGLRRDRLILRDHLRNVDVGAFESEKGKPQRVLFNVAVTLGDDTFDPEDDVDRVPSYDMIVEAIEETLTDRRSDLLETVAERIAAVLFRDARVMAAKVRIEKLDRVPGALGVEILRSRSPETSRASSGSGRLFPSVPTVVFVSNSVLSSERLRAWTDAMLTAKSALIICVDRRRGHGPVPANPDVKFQVDLLSIEQNAWYLASCDDAFGVVTTLTEMKARSGENRISVWAPKRTVLGEDTRTALMKSGEPLAQELAVWLTRAAGARRLVACGCTDDTFGTRGVDEDGMQIAVAPTPEDMQSQFSFGQSENGAGRVR